MTFRENTLEFALAEDEYGNHIKPNLTLREMYHNYTDKRYFWKRGRESFGHGKKSL